MPQCASMADENPMQAMHGEIDTPAGPEPRSYARPARYCAMLCAIYAQAALRPFSDWVTARFLLPLIQDLSAPISVRLDPCRPIPAMFWTDLIGCAVSRSGPTGSAICGPTRSASCCW